MRKISIAIPTWQRCDMTIEAFGKVYDDERISEIVIVDDASDLNVFHDLREEVEGMEKVRLYRNAQNQDCYTNKMIALMLCSNDWAILLDSDNIIDKSYIDKLYEFEEWDADTIYTPSFARPTFDFRPYSNLLIAKNNVASWIDKPMFETMLNACNYFVNKNEYGKVFDNETNPVTSDSIFMCYNWMKSGNKILIVDGLEYEHRVHDGSHYKNNVARTPHGFHQILLEKIKCL